MLRVLDLFSGIGGFSLGLERTGGFKTIAFCEIEEYPRRVLAKHWPEVPCYHDIRDLTAARLATDGLVPDVLCGGFPCQDISDAGPKIGIDGERSGLWGEYARLVSELRPRYVIVENVAALLSRGLGRVLGDLVSIGYDAEWHCIPAAVLGAPHRRDRLWLCAYPLGSGNYQPEQGISLSDECLQEREARAGDALRRCQSLADANSQGLPEPSALGRRLAKALRGFERLAIERRDWWASEPGVGRVADGVPARMDRLRGLGNAVVPQIPEMIGRAILQAEKDPSR